MNAKQLHSQRFHIELQVRVVEEPYLNAAHAQVYRDYCGAVGRFVPHIGRTRIV